MHHITCFQLLSDESVPSIEQIDQQQSRMEIEIPQTGQYPSASTINQGLGSNNLQEVLQCLGLCASDLQSLRPEDIQTIPTECQAFPDLYLQAKLRHENERRLRLRDQVNERVLMAIQQSESENRQLYQGKMEVREDDKLEGWLVKENKRLRILYEQKRRSDVLEQQIVQRMQQAERRKFLAESQKRESILKRAQRRPKARLQPMCEPNYAKPVTANNNSCSSNKQNTTTMNGSHTCRPAAPAPTSPSPPPSLAENIVMRAICRQDFEQNRKMQSKAESFRVQAILGKLRKKQEKVKEKEKMRVMESRELERLRTRVMMARDQATKKGAYITLDDFVEKEKKQIGSQNRIRVRMGKANQIHISRTLTKCQTQVDKSQTQDPHPQPAIFQPPPHTSSSSHHRLPPKPTLKYTQLASWLINHQQTALRIARTENFRRDVAERLGQFGLIDSGTDFTDKNLVEFAEGVLKQLQTGVLSSSILN